MSVSKSHTASPVRTSPFRRALMGALAAGALAIAGLVGIASPASAHDELVGTDPQAGTTLSAVPAQITLTFNEKVLDDAGATAVVVTTSTGTPVQDGDPTVSDNTVTQPIIAAAEPNGKYTVTWKVVSSDGHPVSGEFSFSVQGATPSPGFSPTPTSTPTPTPTETATTAPVPSPTSTAAPAPASDGSVWLWVILVIVVVAVLAGVVYLVASRRRRTSDEQRLRAGNRDADGH